MFQFLGVLVWIAVSISFLGLLGTMVMGMSRSAAAIAKLDHVPTRDEVRQLSDRSYQGRHKKWVKAIVICMLLLVLIRILERVFG